VAPFSPKSKRRIPAWRPAVAWLSIVWERVWRALWPASGILAFFLLLALSDLLPALPGWAHIALLVLLIGCLFRALWLGARRFKFPARFAIDRRLEDDSGLSHRPLEAIEDSQATGDADTASQALWRLHQKQMTGAIGRLRFRVPHPRLFRLDPWALRFALVLSVGVAAIFSEGDITERLKRSVQPNWQIGAADLTAAADAWIAPPEYTRFPPVFLTSDAPTSSDASGGAGKGPRAVKVPKGSRLTAQVSGGDGDAVLLVRGERLQFKKMPGGTSQIDVVLTKPGELIIQQSAKVLGRWTTDIIPDDAPTVEFVRDPVKSKRNSLRFHFAAEDDYGVVKVVASIHRGDHLQAAGNDENRTSKGKDGSSGGAEILEVELPLPGTNAREFSATVFRDLTAHRWAGLPVVVTLIATDALGQKGTSKSVETVLPERRFNHPVAQTIIKERKRVVDSPATYSARAGVMLDNLAWHYDKFNGDVVAFLGLSIAGRRLMNVNQTANVPVIEKLLWDLALRIEDGRVSLSERAMRRAQDALLEALNKNADDAEIGKLLDRYERSLADYFDRLAESLKEMDVETSQSLGLGPKAQMLRRQDLMRMMKDIRKFVQSGQRQRARDMLAQLQELMENMRVKRFAKQSEATRRAIRTINDLKRLVKGQQELLDKTYRIARDRNQIEVKKQKTIPFQGFVPFTPDNKDWSEKNKSTPKNPEDLKRPLKEEIGQQERLRGQLGDIMRRVAELNVPIPGEMGTAETLMRKSAKHLKLGAAGRSMTDQGGVIKALQKSLKSTMSHLASQASEDPFDMDEDWLQGGQSKSDPFGRQQNGKKGPASGGAANMGDEIEIPGIQDGHSAKQIRDELRRRAGENNRPKLERDYFRRLLKRF
jgi:uncharacterized protein (TIGR02302 family)